MAHEPQRRPDARHLIGTASQGRSAAEGDLVVAHFTARGTHQVAWEHPIIGPIAARGTAVQWRGVRLVRVADGAGAATWLYTDSLGLLQQLGALPGLAASLG